MYPWYRDSMSQLGQFCSGNNLPAATAAHIKTENGYSDCMLALDYAQNKVSLLPLPSYSPSANSSALFDGVVPKMIWAIKMGLQPTYNLTNVTKVLL